MQLQWKSHLGGLCFLEARYHFCGIENATPDHLGVGSPKKEDALACSQRPGPEDQPGKVIPSVLDRTYVQVILSDGTRRSGYQAVLAADRCFQQTKLVIQVSNSGPEKIKQPESSLLLMSHCVSCCLSMSLLQSGARLSDVRTSSRPYLAVVPWWRPNRFRTR